MVSGILRVIFKNWGWFSSGDRVLEGLNSEDVVMGKEGGSCAHTGGARSRYIHQTQQTLRAPGGNSFFTNGARKSALSDWIQTTGQNECILTLKNTII